MVFLDFRYSGDCIKDRCGTEKKIWKFIIRPLYTTSQKTCQSYSFTAMTNVGRLSKFSIVQLGIKF